MVVLTQAPGSHCPAGLSHQVTPTSSNPSRRPDRSPAAPHFHPLWCPLEHGSLPTYELGGGRHGRERRWACNSEEGGKQVLALLAGGGEDAGADGRRFGTPSGPKAADDLAVDDRRAQIPLRAVVGRLDVVAVEENVQAVAVRAVALLEPRRLLDPVLERMMEAVHRYEGTVNQVMGDGIMALFGAPLAHEDHAVRACYAALRMQEAVKQYADGLRRTAGITPQIRVGLNSGEVVVRSIGSDLHMDYSAIGQTVHLAARMEQLATPGAILLALATLQLAEGYVQVQALGPIQVRGLSEPVEVYDLLGAGTARSRLQAAANRGLTRFVGRDAEQAELLAHHALRGELWEQAVAYLHQAGLRAMARATFREAVTHLEQALETLRRLPETRETTELTIDLSLDLRNALVTLGDWARMGDLLNEAELLARALGDQHRLARIATFMVSQCLTTGDYDEALRFGQEALSIGRTFGDLSIEMVATSYLGGTHAARGEFSAAASLLERNVALEGDLRYERFGGTSILPARSGASLAEVLAQLGRFDEAIEQAEAAVRIAEVADHSFNLCLGLFALGLAHLRRGELPRATRVLERCLALGRTGQFLVRIPLVAVTLGAAYALAGRADEALPLIAGAVEDFRGLQIHRSPAHILLCAGTTYLSAGRIDEAASHAGEALALSRRLGARGSEAEALHLSGDVASTGGAEEAEGYYREAIAHVRAVGCIPQVNPPVISAPRTARHAHPELSIRGATHDELLATLEPRQHSVNLLAELRGRCNQSREQMRLQLVNRQAQLRRARGGW